MKKLEYENSELHKKVLAKVLGESIKDANFETMQLHGGTVGEVKLISGIAKTAEGTDLHFNFVHKTQKKWNRYSDSNSWRREYDLYASDMDGLFSESLCWPKCYHEEITEDESQIWMEYIEGVSGTDLTVEMYECAARELGKFQGKLYVQNPVALKKITNLSKVDFAKRNYFHYRSWNEVYDYIRSENCEIPKHLCKMLIDIDERSNQIWEQIESLPVVLCHKDFWVTNIFYLNGSIRLIDWDTAGWGYLGEDIASLIADEANVTHMVEYYRKCIPAYYKGFSEYADISQISDNCIWEMILVKFGYRLVEDIKYAESKEEKKLKLETLQKIYEMRLDYSIDK